MQISRSGCIVPDMVEDADKNGVCLAVYLLKFDGYQGYLAEYSGREKIGCRIEAVQYFPFVVFYDGLQLEYVAYQ